MKKKVKKGRLAVLGVVGIACVKLLMVAFIVDSYFKIDRIHTRVMEVTEKLETNSDNKFSRLDKVLKKAERYLRIK